MFQETKLRSVVKMLVWKITATLITGGTIYYFTGEFFESLKITGVAAIFGMTVYYFHERIWDTIDWGRTHK